MLNVSSTVGMLARQLVSAGYKGRMVGQDSRLLTAGPVGQPGVGPYSGA